jgi:hypothetical protein
MMSFVERRLPAAECHVILSVAKDLFHLNHGRNRGSVVEEILRSLRSLRMTYPEEYPSVAPPSDVDLNVELRIHDRR